MDISLHYIKKGAGTPLLLLHGNGENGDHFIANKQSEPFNRAVLEFLKEEAS